MVELEGQQDEFSRKGLNVAAISYDSIAILRDFADRQHITYPLLSDPKSEAIRAFRLLNENFPAGHPWRGVPFPGYYVIDEHGIVQAKYFEQDHRDRYTSASILTREFGGSSGNPQGEAQTPYLKLRWRASNPTVRTGQRVTLVVEAELAKGMHVYAPGVEGGYIPLQWKLTSSKGWIVHPASFPASERLHLAAIGETLPVYRGRFRILRDVSLGLGDELRPFVNARGEVVVEGTFRYQACDDKTCYPPATVPLRWVFRLEEQDRTRPPKSIRHPDPPSGG